MDLFVVTIDGISTSVIVGIYSKLELATTAAGEAEERQFDDYHYIHIHRWVLDDPPRRETEVFFRGKLGA